ncbi:hypothetical protein EB796_018271 [Bugula neritina]|uniref:Uncharacterized protein n=1 Tax=Bugula neritina TaxID=10212 RepID=A0A7J7JCS4_BUGNE|nr:hypothetical protein EB796_018271 [Bugula neritina]
MLRQFLASTSAKIKKSACQLAKAKGQQILALKLQTTSPPQANVMIIKIWIAFVVALTSHADELCNLGKKQCQTYNRNTTEWKHDCYIETTAFNTEIVLNCLPECYPERWAKCDHFCSDFEYIEECSEENQHPPVTDSPQDEQNNAAIKPFSAFLIMISLMILLITYWRWRAHLSRRRKTPAVRNSDEEKGNSERQMEELVSLNKQTPLFDSTDTGKSQSTTNTER